MNILHHLYRILNRHPELSIEMHVEPTNREMVITLRNRMDGSTCAGRIMDLAVLIDSRSVTYINTVNELVDKLTTLEAEKA